MSSKRNRLALAGMLTLAVTLCAGLTFGGAAAAKKKGGGGGGTKTISKGGAPIPDSTISGVDTDVPPDGFVDCGGNGGCYKNGVLGSRIVVGQKLRTAKITDLNVRVDISHTDIGDLDIYLVAPNGAVITLAASIENYPAPLPAGAKSLGKFGPTTFDDEALLNIDDTASSTEPGGTATDGTEAFAPYAGSFKPQSGSLSEVGSKLFGTWTLVVFDNDPAFGGPGDTADVGTLNSWALIAELKGGGGKKK